MNTLFLDHENGRVAYDDTGSGPLVIAVPSMGDLRGEYRYLTPQLAAAGFRVVTMDVRGHGETSPSWPDYSVAGVGEDILALIHHLDAGPAFIIGTSMAAGAAIWAAAEGPADVRGLVLIGPFVRGETTWQNRLLYTLLFARPWGPYLWQKYHASLYPTQKPADFTAYSAALRANLQEKGRLEALKQMMLASKAASAVRIIRVTAPTLVIMGSRDPDFKNPAAEAARVAEGLSARCEMIPDAGHYPHAEMPARTGPVIVDFLVNEQAKINPPAQPAAAPTGDL